jgi:16S rRNA (cytosine967-C5)-methyltransferase
MKLHNLLVKAVEEALIDIFQNHKHADRVIERLLKSNPKWGSRDRAFIAETTYECVRWWRLYNHLAGERASVLDCIGVHLVMKEKGNLEHHDFHQLSYNFLQKRYDAIKERKILESITDDMDALGVSELGEEKWAKELAVLNTPSRIVLRANQLKINALDLKEKLLTIDCETDTTPLSIDALILKKRGNVFATGFFKQGLFEVQDAGSQAIAPFLQVEPGMRVIDACAGAGGKSLHLAALMKNKGTLIAMDTEAWKLEELRKRAKRNGVNIIETRVIDTTKVIKRQYDSADRLLLDVPCSGMGVLRRNPDAKWKLNNAFFENIRQTQAEILQSYARMVKKGGKMVYATCSIFPSENEAQVKAFLEKNDEWQWVDERTLTPATDGFDGFYMALLERKA